MTQPQNPLNATEDFEASSLLQPSNFDSATQAWDGSGLFGSAANTIYDGFNGDWGAFAGDAVSVGLDLLGVAMNPLGSVLSGVIGWLIEHIGFLKEPLDLLAGDPDAVTAMAATWSSIATRMQETSAKYSDTLTALSDAHGPAIDAYRTAVKDFSTVVAGGADHATSAARAMTVAATMVGVVRGAVRDSIATFASDRIIRFAAASALAPVTFGASQAAFIAESVASGAILAGKNAKKVSKVIKQLEKVSNDAKESRNIIKGTVRNLDKSVGQYNRDAVKHAGDSLRMTKKAAAGKLNPSDADKLKGLGKRGDELKTARTEAGEKLAANRNDNLREGKPIGDPRIDTVGDQLESKVGPITVPTYPRILANSAVQAWSDQSHREQDGHAKQDEKDKEWREHWEAERRKAAEPPKVQGPPASPQSEKWRTEGDL
ncbi:hypothetical protein LWC34_37855 [Kibdelosporangium philippinense]|uniref:PPE family protein n=1 Tax=Kibdelosporangium philippinense TaxID=211113 RepID=A0ABS8ZLU0_9PSEU|nr:hypothetical protein [Kibdelosporangium philippinense]MCE7008537.1 hypothetical protein [Kibdelosporangium philippinense]